MELKMTLKNHFPWPGLLVLGACCFFNGCVVSKWMPDPQHPVKFEHGRYREPEKILDGSAVVYRLEEGWAPGSSEAALLAAHAPILVHGRQSSDKHRYNPKADELGRPRLYPKKDVYQIAVDVTHPVLFGRVEEMKFHQARLKQLIYSFWYPMHAVGGIQEGSVDGGIIRLTLDAAGRPAIMEYSMQCGCYHGVLVADFVESWAREEFGEPLPDKTYAVEQTVPDHFDWVVRDVVDGCAEFDHPIFFIQAGSHQCVAVQTQKRVGPLDVFPAQSYTIDDYDRLTHLPVVSGDGATASMFNADGLVWDGRRPGEEIVFPTIDHPGWPRRLDKVKIHWDEEFFLTPGLCRKYLRLPAKMADPRAAG